MDTTNVESNQASSSEDVPLTIERVVDRLTSSYQTVRLELLQRLSEPEVQPELVIDGIFSTLHIYTDSKSIAAVETLLKKLLAANSTNKDVLKYFLSLLRKHTVASLKSIGTSLHSPRIILNSWHSIFLESCLKDVAGENAVLSLVVGNQSALLDSFKDTPNRIRNHVFRRFVASLKHPEIFQLYVKQVLDEEPTPTHIILVGLLITHIKVHPKKFDLATYKAKLLDWYSKVTLAAITQPHPLAHELFAPFLQSLDNAEYSATIIPALTRALKRSPEVAAWNAATLLQLSTQKAFDAAQHKDALLPVLFPLALGSSDKLRSDAINVLRQLALRFKNPAGFVAFVTEITKQSPLQYPYQRYAVFVSLLNASVRLTVHSDPIEVDTNAAVAAILNLVPTIEKEASEESKCLGIRALGAWLKFVPTIPEPAVKLFGTLLKTDKEPIRAATLEAIENAVSNKPSSIDSDLGSHEVLKPNAEKAQQAAAWVDAIVALIKNAKGPKAADTSSPVVAARLLVKLASVSPAVEGKLDKTVWQAILGSGGFIFQPAYLTRFTEKESISFLELLETVLILAHSRIKQADASFHASYVWLLTHPLWAVRRATATATARLHPQLPRLSDILVASTIKLVREISVSVTANAANANAIPPTTTTTPIPSPQVLGAALSRSVSHSLSDSQLPSLFVASHLPYVEAQTWQHVVKSLGKLSGDILQKEDIAKAVVDYVMGNEALLSKDVNFQVAGQRSLATAVQDSDDSTGPLAISVFHELLSKDIIEGVTAHEVAVFNTPEGELYEKVDAGYVPKVREDKRAAAVPKEHKKRGERGLYSKADIAYEEKLRKDLEEKKKKEEEAASAGKPKHSEAELKVLAKETQIRAKVAQIHATVENALQGLRAIAVASQEVSHRYLRTFIELLIPVVQHPLTSNLTLPVLVAMGRCLQPPMQRFAHPTAHLIVTIYAPKSVAKPEGSIDYVPENHLLIELQKVLSVLHAHGKPIGAPSFSFIFPILKACLEKTYSFTTQETALDIVETHLNHGGNYPRGAMIGSLAHVIAASPRLEARAKAAVITLGSGLRTTDMAHACAAYISPNANVRHAILSAIDKTPGLASSTFPEMHALTSVLWAGKYDTDAANATLAEAIWKNYKHPLTNQAPQYLDLFLPPLSHKEEDIRTIYAAAIAGAMRTYPDSITAALAQLFTIYEDLLPLDGNREYDTAVNIQLRSGIAATTGKAGDALQGDNLATVFHWMIDASLGDSEESVNHELVQSGMEIVDVQGSANKALMFPIFEKFLSLHDTGSRRQDEVRESVIVFMGVLARHVVGDEERVAAILARLVDALKTPSELVQTAVAKCLTQLIPSVRGSAPALVTRLLKTLRDGKGGYAALRGAAYGLAGVVKGLGVGSMKQHEVLQTLGAALDDKKSMTARQAGLLAYECLSATLCRGFEPYVSQLLPKLLVSFGDNSNDVRVAAGAAAKKIMGQLTPFGVKKLLPVLLKPLEDKSSTWRTKEGSIELLGAMAFCAPKQLSTCLPTIVPRLVEVLTDTHDAVQKATREALAHVGSVIRNPEVQIHVDKILKALYDPDTTKQALDALLNTNFVHSIDAPSLSLIMPLLDRGLRDRATETKKKAAQIVGNMCSLTDPNELIPYLGVLTPDLKSIVTDPIPDVRTMAAIAMGSLVQGLGEEKFAALIAWMLETIRSDLGSVERSGASQGLSHVLGALGPEKLSSIFPDLVTSTHSNKYFIREGAMYMFSFLPIGMPRGFQQFLPKVLPCVLGGLADDSEIVREVAMRAGQTIVTEYYMSAVDVLIPCLEEGLFSDNWRIRQSSVALLGDFMAKVTGGDISEDDSERTNRAKTDITKAMGEARVHSILAALYMIRFDVNTAVRQKTMLVWKSLVNNTPKTLREILPTLMTTLIACMGSTNLDKRQVAARTLGDLVSKLGERVLPEIIPMLEHGLDSKEKDRRLGVCVGLAEVISAAGKQQLGAYLQDVIPTVRKALQDRLADVREAAAQAFDMLYTSVGPKVLEEVLPPLLHTLSKERPVEGEPSPAGDALRQILLVRSHAVLPFLIPKLIARPLTPANAAALGSVASVAGAALNEHLGDILPVLLEESTNPSHSAEVIKEIKAATETIILAVQDEGLDILIPELQQKMESEEATTRAGAANLLAAFCGSTKADLEPYTHELIVSLLGLFNDPEESVLVAAWNALGSVTKNIKKENLSFIEAVDEGIEAVSDTLSDDDDRVLPGFCIAKGLQPILPLLLNGLMLGSPEQRELSAAVIGQAIKLTSSEALKPFVVQITGPLIRVSADRFPWQVKSAILSTLTLLIGKGAASMKPFLPQLQPTFVKALHDPTAIVRKNAAMAMGKMMALIVRIDPLLNELLAGISSTEGGVQLGMLSALRSVLEKAPTTVDPAALLKVANALLDLLEHNEEKVRISAAKTLAVYSKVGNAEQVDTFFATNVLEKEGSSWQGRHGRSVTVNQLAKAKPDLIAKHYKTILGKTQQQIKDDKPGVRQNAADALGFLLESTPAKSAELIPVLTPLLNDSTSDVALAALKAVKRFAKAHPDAMSRHLVIVIPLVVARLKDKVLPVKIEAERVLLHALQLFSSNESVYKDYVASTDAVFNKYLTDYVTRVIKKLKPRSDDEAEEDDEDT